MRHAPSGRKACGIGLPASRRNRSRLRRERVGVYHINVGFVQKIYPAVCISKPAHSFFGVFHISLIGKVDGWKAAGWIKGGVFSPPTQSLNRWVLTFKCANYFLLTASAPGAAWQCSPPVAFPTAWGDTGLYATNLPGQHNWLGKHAQILRS